jgi:hypothetical protein
MLRDVYIEKTNVMCLHLLTKRAACSRYMHIYAHIQIRGRIRGYTTAVVQMLSSLQRFNPLGVAASVGLRSALPKVLVGAALLGGGGSVLFAGSAQAACGASIGFATWAGGTALTCDDKQFTYNSSSGLPAGSGDQVSASVDPTGTYLFLYDFVDPNFNTISSFTLDYTASIVGTDDFFVAVDIDSNVPTTAPSEVLTATYTGGTAPVVLESINGDQDPAVLPVAGKPTTLSVSNVYTTPAGGSISEFQNSFRQDRDIPGTTVPGPLPLVGAGMAFGFSRKLRSRIKARVQA